MDISVKSDIISVCAGFLFLLTRLHVTSNKIISVDSQGFKSVQKFNINFTRNRLFAEMTSGWIFKLVKILKIIYNKIL